MILYIYIRHAIMPKMIYLLEQVFMVSAKTNLFSDFAVMCIIKASKITINVYCVHIHVSKDKQ